MRRLYKIFLGGFLVFLTILILYAAPPTRAFTESTLGPPITAVFGGAIDIVVNSWIWQNYVLPFPNQLVLGALCIGFPIAWLWHKSFNRFRGYFHMSAHKETGDYPLQTKPISQQTTTPQPKKTSKAPAPTPQPTPPPQTETPPVEEPKQEES